MQAMIEHLVYRLGQFVLLLRLAYDLIQTIPYQVPHHLLESLLACLVQDFLSQGQQQGWEPLG
jgi:hypothetical protein